MRRREFIALGGVVAFPSPPRPAYAQKSGKTARVSVLSTGNPRSAPIYRALEQKLRDLGYIEGQNLIIEFRDAEGNIDKLPGLAAELVRLNVDVIIVASDPATRAAKDASATIPIVMVGVNYDPVTLGYVSSLARPGANLTGIFFLYREVTAKRLDLFRQMLPSAKRVAVVFDALAADQLVEVEAASQSAGFELERVDLGNFSYDLNRAFEVAMRSQAEGLFVLTTPLIFRKRAEIAESALKNGLPTSFAHREHVEDGGLTSYGPNFADMWRLAAVYVDRILKAENPADLPVQQPTIFELVISLKTANALGLTVPPVLLARADEVIE